MKKKLKLSFECMIITLFLFFAFNIIALADTKDIEINQDRSLDPFFNMMDTFEYNAKNDSYLYPDNYGGCYVNDDGQLVINVTNKSSQVEDEYYERCGTKDIIINEVEFSYNRLLEAFNELFVTLPMDKCVLNISQRNNNLNLLASSGEYMKKTGNFKYIIDKVLNDYEFINFELGDVIQEDASTVKGGTLCTNGENFSAGYWATYNSGGGYCLVTTGHPFYASTSEKTVKKNGESAAFGVVSQNNVYIGTYMDAALITRYDAAQTPVHTTLINGVTVNGTRSLLPESLKINLVVGKSTAENKYVTANNVTISSQTTSYTSGATGQTMQLYYIDYEIDDVGESGSPVYYLYNNKYYLFGIIVGKQSSGGVVCRASVINTFFNISAYTG